MALVPIFKGLVTPDAHLRLRETQRERRHEWLRCLAGSNVELIIRREPRQRTLDQNAYIHAVPAPLVADAMGESIDRAKFYMMGECFGWKEDAHTGELIPVIAHTASLDVEQGTYFIEWAPPWALETFGGRVQIPLPGEVEWR